MEDLKKVFGTLSDGLKSIATGIEALAEKIICLLQNKELARSVGERACETIHARFSMETMLSFNPGKYILSRLSITISASSSFRR